MAPSELDRIAEIDRSEHVTREYAYRRGSLEARDVDVKVPTWFPTGDHEDADTLAGIAIYRPRLAEGMANLAVLHVSRSYRRKGVGSLLAEEVARLARADGARRLYVSATPTGPTVDFYRSHGFEPTDQPNAALFALEPHDIHMIRELFRG